LLNFKRSAGDVYTFDRAEAYTEFIEAQKRIKNPTITVGLYINN
jgi:hypothetical protein